MFITLDGLDGTGKSTQCLRLAESMRGTGMIDRAAESANRLVRHVAKWLRGPGGEVVTCRDPGDTPLGDSLRAILLDQRGEMTATAEAMLFMASRAELVARVIRPALDRGACVISDRFLLSTVVYQGYGGGLNPDDLWAVGKVATGGLEPDLTIVLDMPVDAAAVRRGRAPDRIELRDLAFHERVRRGFLTEAARRPDDILVIDATADVDTIHAAIFDAVAALY